MSKPSKTFHSNWKKSCFLWYTCTLTTSFQQQWRRGTHFCSNSGEKLIMKFIVYTVWCISLEPETKRKLFCLIFTHRYPTGLPGHTALKWVHPPLNALVYSAWCNASYRQCSYLFILFIVFQSTCRAHHVLASIRLPVTDRDDCNYMLSADSLRYQNRFVIHQPTRCPHMHTHALTQTRSGTQTTTHASPVINPDGPQLISNSTSLCFQLWI